MSQDDQEYLSEGMILLSPMVDRLPYHRRLG